MLMSYGPGDLLFLALRIACFVSYSVTEFFFFFLQFLALPVYNSTVPYDVFGCVELFVEALSFVRVGGGIEFVAYNGVVVYLCLFHIV